MLGSMDPGRPPTKFEQSVYDAICKIPKGKVTTYKLLAKTLNCGSNQAVGQALKRNPFAPEVPCHRVIATNLSLGGFSGQTEGPKIAKKRRLLKSEGVTFDAKGKLVDPAGVCALH